MIIACKYYGLSFFMNIFIKRKYPSILFTVATNTDTAFFLIATIFAFGSACFKRIGYRSRTIFADVVSIQYGVITYQPVILSYNFVSFPIFLSVYSVDSV